MKISKNAPLFSMWNEKQCEAVLDHILGILEKIGCRIKNEKARKLMKEAGCQVEGDMVKIPKAVMRSAIDSAPKAITLFDQNGNPAMELDGEHSYFGPPISTVFVRDPFTGEKRKGVRKDAYHAGLICDALPNIGWASAMSGISDGNSNLDSVYEVEALLKSTAKPIMYWAGSMENLKIEFEMFEAVAGNRETLKEKPFSICLVCPMNPLVHNEDSLEQIMYLAERNGVTVYISGASLGCTVPATAAGAVSVGVADTLVGLLVSQLTRKGAPFILSCFCDNLDMRTMTIQRSHPEMVVAEAAVCSLLNYVGIPFCVSLGDTDSGIFDQVPAFDGAVTLYTAILGRAPMIMSMGGFESCNMADYIGTVYGNEIVEYLKKLAAGAEISEETLALDEIEEVGPGGDFIVSDTTLEFCRTSWAPDIMKARTISQYETEGQESIEKKYRKRICEIIEKGSSRNLNEEILEKITSIMARAEK